MYFKWVENVYILLFITPPPLLPKKKSYAPVDTCSRMSYLHFYRALCKKGHTEHPIIELLWNTTNRKRAQTICYIEISFEQRAIHFS